VPPTGKMLNKNKQLRNKEKLTRHTAPRPPFSNYASPPPPPPNSSSFEKGVYREWGTGCKYIIRIMVLASGSRCSFIFVTGFCFDIDSASTGVPHLALKNSQLAFIELRIALSFLNCCSNL
jgi:hypothetical protein